MGEVWVEIFCDDSNFALHLPFLLLIVRLLFLCLRLSAVIDVHQSKTSERRRARTSAV